MIIVQSALGDAHAAILAAASSGKDVSAAQIALSEAQLAFDAGDYALALQKASEAKRLVLAATSKPTTQITQQPNVSTKPTTLPQQPTQTGFPWLLVLIGIFILILIAVAIYFFFMRKGK